MKIDSLPQAIVLTAGIVVTGGIVVALAFAGWSSEAIIGFGTLALGLFAGQYVNTRKSATIEAKTDEQSTKLDKIVSQTNGLSEAERDDIAERAAIKIAHMYRSGRL
jgi:hypothetical protein